MNFPDMHKFVYLSEFQCWINSMENAGLDVLIVDPNAHIFPVQKLDFLKYAEPVISALKAYGLQYIQQLSKLNIDDGELNAIRYNEFNGIPYVELQYVFDTDPYYQWSVGFEQNPLQGYLLDVRSPQLDYGYSAIILHREPI